MIRINSRRSSIEKLSIVLYKIFSIANLFNISQLHSHFDKECLRKL